MTKFYHYTNRRDVDNILAEGLRPGSEVMRGERLPFIMLTRDRYRVQAGGLAYFEVEIDEADSRLRKINGSWVEYHGSLPSSSITAVAVPPKDNEEVFRLVKDFGTDSPEFSRSFEYRSVKELVHGWK